MEVVRVEELGDIVAFKPKEIQVLGQIYDKVPTEFIDDFCVVCNSAKLAYDNGVKEAKTHGEKPKAASLKKDAIDKVIRPFLIRYGIEQKAVHERVVRTTNPRIPSDNEKVTVNVKPGIIDSDADITEADEIFSNFDSEELTDDLNVDLGEEGSVEKSFDAGSDVEDLGGFDFEGLLDD